MAKKGKGAGGKLARSEIVQARLSPKVKLVAEIMARNERRTLSSLFETLVDEVAKDYPLQAQREDQISLTTWTTLNEVIELVWHTDEIKRFILFAFYLPHLLTYEESRVWNLITDTPYFWKCYQVEHYADDHKTLLYREWSPISKIDALIYEHVAEYWERLQDDAVSRNDFPDKDIVGEAIDFEHSIKAIDPPDYVQQMEFERENSNWSEELFKHITKLILKIKRHPVFKEMAIKGQVGLKPKQMKIIADDIQKITDKPPFEKFKFTQEHIYDLINETLSEDDDDY